MPGKKIAPYGSWESPITTGSIVSHSINIGDLFISNEGKFWQEMRPIEGGRSTIMCQTSDGCKREIIPKSYNARTRVHEYGGGSFLVHDDGVYFSNFSDQQIHKVNLTGGNPTQITNEPLLRFADGAVDAERQQIIYVGENHDSIDEPVNCIVSVDLQNNGEVTILASGADFYASPVISPDGRKLVWVQWNHPNMPWDSTELYTADLSHSKLHNIQKIAGNGESICQPLWSPNGILHFVSDLSGWWNIYKYTNGESYNLTPIDAEFTVAQWGLGTRFYGFIDGNQIICSYNSLGFWKIGLLDSLSSQFSDLKLNVNITEINKFSGLKACNGRALFVGGSPDISFTLFIYDMRSQGKLQMVQESVENTIEAIHFSKPQPVKYVTTNAEECHAFYYPPNNANYEAPQATKPPLVILSHGGPTGATSNTLNLAIQYWTSRGFAILDVNYRGSTGYGTRYRKALVGNWGINDVDDCVNGGNYLVSENLVHPEKIAIRGGSAGGFTTLACLTFTDFFAAGASYYGVSDLTTLAEETHKFESRYLDSMIGKYPEERQKYLDRSPINHTENLSCPVILFQGLDDEIVLPNQSQKMYASLKAKGVPVSYLEFEGEQHGFRKSENIQRALEAEFYFYSHVFGFKPFDPIEPVEIDNK
ncbi:MAG: S9 family peptidase [SAR202 cluster bacterium]|jgi:dipeptidyl aminopeptidase/acylaminoacyl peptidase|nr:S9 family peptidase [SAR202 cluster bacterium]|tara:strand:- start:388 stop:2331 length:1944 start_codon:yes stop_codon:yes gene_type:complete